MAQTKAKKSTSIAAFLFMPQFHLCFEGFAHLKPLLMRVLATSFESVGLIPRNHPATRYGMEGVQKYGFAELMGEVWFNLRTNQSDATQWGMFLSVVGMIGLVICALVSFFLTVFFNIGAVAMAQVFQHPGNPYGQGAGKSNSAAMSSALPSPESPTFDTHYSANSTFDGGSVDYALMILDKVLRQGSMVGSPGNMGTGSTQSALQGLFQVYNTGILLVAAVMIFWMIMSVVIDTARTGQVGGGRHNMVWTPIRVVFALGMMIPLGSTGFSSGQFMIMKLAEWGSNFGSSAWGEYIETVQSSSSIIPGFTPNNVSGLVSGIMKVKTCQVAYNAKVRQQNSTPSSTELIMMHKSHQPLIGRVELVYSNDSGGNKCGGLWLTEGGVGGDAWVAGSAALTNLTGGLFSSITLNQFMMQKRLQMQMAVNEILDETDSYAGQTLVMPIASRFACLYVGKALQSNNSPNPVMAGDVLYSDDTIVSGKTCTEVGVTQAVIDAVDTTTLCAGGGVVPGTGCHKLAAELIVDRMNNAFGTSPGTLGSITDHAGVSADGMLNALMPDMKERGWAAMGMWYQTISMMVRLSKSMENIDAGYVGGTLWAAGPQQAGDRIDSEVQSLLSAYDDWWTLARQTSPGATGSLTGRNSEIQGSGFQMLAQSVGEGISEMAEVTGDTLADFFGPRDSEWFMFDIIDGSRDNVYPLAGLTATGDAIMLAGGAMIAGDFAIKKYFKGLSSEALSSILVTVGLVMIIAGAVLSFYVPLLPFLRVAFAVVSWIMAVFEAVCLVPMACLAHLTTQGEGIGARGVWITWLGILLRPVMVVLGFVGAMLVYNAFLVYFQVAFAEFAITMSTASSGIGTVVSKLFYTIIFVSVCYTMVNTTLKLMDQIPNAALRYLGGGVGSEASYDHGDRSEGMMMAGANMLKSASGSMAKMGPKSWQDANKADAAKKQGESNDALAGAIAKAVGGGGAAGGAGGAGAAGALSDRRLKEDIAPAGTSNGFNLYTFKYIGEEGRYLGVMADEVLRTHPEAIVHRPDGFMAVRYDLIGVEFKKLH